MIKLLMCITLVCISLYAKNYYVSTIKTGNNDGTNWINSWNDFSFVNWSDIGSGDTLFISGGTDTAWYNDTLKTNCEGDSLSQIVIAPSNDPGHNGVVAIKNGIQMLFGQNYVTIDGRNRLVVYQKDHFGIFIYSSQHVLLKNIEVFGLPTSVRKHGIHINNSCYYITISNCYIHATTADGVNINVAQDFSGNFPDTFCGLYLVENCVIDSCADDGIQIATNRATVKGTTIRYVPVNVGGIDPQGAHPDGIQIARDKGQQNFFNNTFINCQQGIFLENTGGYIKAVNNVFYDIPEMLPVGHTNRFISINQSVLGSDGYIVIANNIFFKSQWNALVFFDPIFEEEDSLIIRNNIFLNCKRWVAADKLFSFKVIQDDNVFFTTEDSPAPAQAIPNKLIVINPMFNSWKNYDFTLNDDSKLIGAGTDLSVYFNFDREGNKRPKGSGWDIGPYQKVTSSDPRDQSKGVRLIKK